MKEVKFGNITLIHGDCMEYMATLKDKAFDLAVVDPPYGIGADLKNSKSEFKSKKSAALSNNFGGQIWDTDVPTKEYFMILKKISKKQIIWGANYFGLTGGMLYWHKNVTMPTYSSGEIAWLSWLQKVEFVNIAWHGMIQEDMKHKEERIHPTQKPIALYEWIYKNYSKPTDRIIDTHLGSGSNAIAAMRAGLEFVGIEIDEEYFNGAVERVQAEYEAMTMGYAKTKLNKQHPTLF